jgi:nematocidal protein AidA
MVQYRDITRGILLSTSPTKVYLSMSEQSIIDILIAIDAETIIASYPSGTAATPTSIDTPLIYMMVAQDDAVFGEGSKELKIRAKTLDVIRWRETTLALNGNYYGILYKFFALKGGELLSPPEPLMAAVQTPLPDPDDPLHPKIQTVNSYFWSTTVLMAGSTTYAFNFMVLDRSNNVLGYYFWDPFITISA